MFGWMRALGSGRNARPAALGLVLGLFVAAQTLYALHLGEVPDALAKHAAASCEFCLAGAKSGDPGALAPVILAPEAAVEAIAPPALTRLVSVFPVRAAAPRGPPLR